MKCPHCEYRDRDDEYKRIGDEFYELPVQMEQQQDYGQHRRAYLYACPECGKAFIEH